MATIVVADDDPISQLDPGHIIRKLGHEVVAPRTASRRSNACASSGPTWSSSTLAMPEMDGLTALRHLRDEEGGQHLRSSC